MTKVGEPYIDACHCGKPKNVRWVECNDCCVPGCDVCDKRREKMAMGKEPGGNCNLEHVSWSIVWICVISVAAAFFLMGAKMMDLSWRKDAVKKGNARWVVCDDDGETKWEWIPR